MIQDRSDVHVFTTDSRAVPARPRPVWGSKAMAAALMALLVGVPAARACTTPVSVCETAVPGSLSLIAAGRPLPVFVDGAVDPAVKHAAASLRADLGRVSGQDAAGLSALSDAQGPVVIIGVLGASPTIDALVAAGKLSLPDLAGEWEGFRQVVVEQPAPNIPRALVIIGADRRGAVYGTYDLSERIGVSPWVWWADVPVVQKRDLHIVAGTRADRPRVKYRGFFINDEDPAFSGWAKAKFGGINADLYGHVFELLLRLKGNYLWPAMWAPKAFNDDDPRNMVLADEMGVVMGTSHHEPLTRAQHEWHRNKDQGITGGRWDYTANAENLRAFWRGGIERMMSKGDGKGYESLLTLGMRGDGDEPMAEGTATQLLEKIVADQRQIIADVTGKPADQTPQLWALYKEVQDYYDHGMRVPADVTLLFADDNWGQIRRLPVAGRDPLDRPGGYGVYYHFDYVGAPRNYKWLNTVQISKVWQQMNLAYESGARNLWIVNIGDIKPIEYPLDFFLDMAWNPEAMSPASLAAYPREWASRTFGAALGPEIAEIIATYGTYAARRKPELIDQDSFPIGEGMGPVLDGGPFGQMVDDWRVLVTKVESVKARLRPDQLDAYFQLVEHPVLALSNLYEMYYAAAWNRRLMMRNDPRADYFAVKVEQTFQRDADLTAQYHALKGGKWDGMMNQIHMSYVIWQTPTRQSMPSVSRVSADTPPDRLAAQIKFTQTRQVDPKLVELPASAFARARAGKGLSWQILPHLGQGNAVVALPQGRPATTPEDGVRLEYDVTLAATAPVHVTLRLSPTLDTTGGDGIRIGVSIDDGPVQIVTSDLIPTPGGVTKPQQAAWMEAVKNNSHTVEARFPDMKAGRHVVKVWRLDDNAVLERLTISQH
ncbi:glycosyl hydrolase 115 family protein [Niveispirillum irakense]|uniref:glycosyl hydrolase 115 family protein n=1 Tax=Niveispirillum irakense TaxID=34011 RepID=UPI00040C3177|nr:glycosyl hydrolase 115 family protein [Niveispirillum irakense]